MVLLSTRIIFASRYEKKQYGLKILFFLAKLITNIICHNIAAVSCYLAMRSFWAMKWLITGGAGFIGCNTAHQLLQMGHEVIVLDNLSRKGSQSNLDWLQENHPHLQFLHVDIVDYDALYSALKSIGTVDVVLHLAAQVAVTLSVNNPRHDFMVNALGSFNVLEAVRTLGWDSVLLYASTNKVYGHMDEYPVVELDTRYTYKNLATGNPTTTPIDFYSPYGCSKGTADQYFRDYHRVYGMKTIVFRNSCIYGIRQFGVEDQGWIAWFIIAAVLGKKITIFGDGKQVRDVLFIDDLVNAFIKAVENQSVTQGQIYNIGGGAATTLSVWAEFGPLLERVHGAAIPVDYQGWRVGDQPVYISDISKATTDFGWQPQISVEDGIERLYKWVVANRNLFE